MYTEEDLNDAVKTGIFTDDSVTQFRRHVANQKNTTIADEENFRLISGFNDVFVVIASGLLLVSLAWIGSLFSPVLGAIAVSVASWFLAEFFVKKRRMALPAIGLLLSFLGGIFAAPIVFTQQPNEVSFVISGLFTSIAAIIHWKRFRVPVTVAAGMSAIVACITAVIISIFPLALQWINSMIFIAGLLTFGLAMYWDAADRSRQTRSSDVAFWLHLVSAPMIVHPIFTSLGVFDGTGGIATSLIVVGLYVLLAIVSIAVDRRAIMVSSLVYVVYAFSALLENTGIVSYSFALTGMCIGATLLLLSAFWHTSRKQILKLVPQPIQMHLPEIKV